MCCGLLRAPMVKGLVRCSLAAILPTYCLHSLTNPLSDKCLSLT